MTRSHSSVKPFRWKFPAALALGLSLLACCGTNSAESKLTVFAAASCADWVQKLPNRNELRLQFGPSSGLARQIADGAPADVFITAHKSWIEYLMEADKVEGQPISFASNTLVCIALEGTTFETEAPQSLAALAPALRADDRIAIADESVPAGDYARQALQHAAQLETLRPYFVGQDDARSTLRAVTQGQARVGFVYASDASLDSVQILFTLDPSSHESIYYWACAVRSKNQQPSSAALLDSLHSPAVQTLLQENGFQPELSPNWPQPKRVRNNSNANAGDDTDEDFEDALSDPISIPDDGRETQRSHSSQAADVHE